MEILSQVSSWLFENESLISALAGLLAIGVVLFVPVRGLFRMIASAGQRDRQEERDADASLASRPSIIVIPFDDYSHGVAGSGRVDGFTEELTTLLAGMPGYHVVARNIAQSLRGPGVDIRSVGKDLGVRYAVEGSIRAMSSGLRVTVQFIETATGAHLWAQRFDTEGDDLDAELDSTARQVAMQLGSALTRAEAGRASGDQDAWTLYQQAKNLMMSSGWSKESFSEIADLLRRSIEVDADYAPSRAYLALILAMGHWVQLVDEPDSAHDESLASGEKALELDPNSSEVLGYVGCAFSDLGYHQRGIPIIEKAIELDPSNAQAFAALGGAKIVSGELPEGIKQLEHAVELSPQDAGYAPWSTMLSFGCGFLGHEEKSLKWARSACKSHARYFPAQIALARALVAAGLPDAAREALAEARRQYPTLSSSYVAEFTGQWVLEQFVEAGIDVDLVSV